MFLHGPMCTSLHDSAPAPKQVSACAFTQMCTRLHVGHVGFVPSTQCQYDACQMLGSADTIWS